MAYEFQVGDRVRATQNIGTLAGERICIGDAGVVIDGEFPLSICVQFDRKVGGHSCGGKGLPGHCWYVSGWELEPEFDEDNNICPASDSELDDLLC